ncbi:MAG: hypothetical protein LBU26_06115 [Synergistaceae bacterium]|jgi:epoxyqueuosine reductase QueG|nr:hypothetical protein [Synergistaceae bacterium]
MKNSIFLKGVIKKEIDDFINKHCKDAGFENIWREPAVKYADPSAPEIAGLKKTVCPEHYMPWDFMEEPKSIISYFLPFKPEIAASNIDGDAPSALWGEAYVRTNEMAARLNDRLVEAAENLGFKAAVPRGAFRISDEKIYSRWSQRHIAWIAGHGTFGINNMLIADQGSCGRYFSVVTALPVETDEPARVERCMSKRDSGTCGVCVRRCPAEAFTPDGYDRAKCMEACAGNGRKLGNPKAGVCGKCDVGLPCSFKNPIG